MTKVTSLSNGKNSALILGSSGFIGGNVEQELLSHDWVLENRYELNLPEIERMNLERFGIVINCIGTTSEDKELAFRVNSHFPEFLASTMRRTGGRLIHFGSSSEYTPSLDKLSETSSTKRTSIYSASKLDGTRSVLVNSKIGNAIVLRPFAIVVPRNTLIKRASSRILQLQNSISTSERCFLKNKTAVRDFVGIDSLTKVVKHIVDKQGDWPEILNIGSGVGFTMEEFIKQVNPNALVNGGVLNEIDQYISNTTLLETFLGLKLPQSLSKILS